MQSITHLVRVITHNGQNVEAELHHCVHLGVTVILFSGPFTAPTGTLEEVLYITCPLVKIHLQYKMHFSS